MYIYIMYLYNVFIYTSNRYLHIVYLSSGNNSNQDKCINTSAELQSSKEGGTALHNNISFNCVYELTIEGRFCSDSVFNLSRRTLTETEIKILEKGLNFAPIENKINKLELQTNFNEFFRRMRTK